MRVVRGMPLRSSRFRWCAVTVGVWLAGAGMARAQAQEPGLPPAAAAPSGAEKVAPWIPPGVPLGVSEVVTGGSWSAGGRSGFYRAVVVQAGREGARTVAVFLQWLTENEDGDAVAITASVPIREMEGRIIPFASVALESDVPNDVQLTIAAPEAADPAARLTIIRAAGPGIYVVIPPSPAAAAPANPQPPPEQSPPAETDPRRVRRHRQ